MRLRFSAFLDWHFVHPDDGTLIDRSSHALDRPGSHVADDKYTAYRLQQQRSQRHPSSGLWKERPIQSAQSSCCPCYPASSSQAVARSAPMKRKRWRIGFSVSSPVELLCQRTRSIAMANVNFCLTFGDPGKRYGATLSDA